jgi:Formyl transferase
MEGKTLKIVILTSNPRGNAARIAHYIARALPDIRIIAAIVDTGARPDRQRQLSRLRAWHRHGGVPYSAWRLWLQLWPKLRRAPPPPRYSHTLGELGREFGFRVIEVPNINSPEAERELRALGPDVGVSIGNRIIAPSIFSIPPHGMLNLHHGKIPEFRGGPPAFWELYRGAASMGVSVHRIDADLDHGELLAQAEVPILDGEGPRRMMERAYEVDYRLLTGVLRDMLEESLRPIPVDLSGSRANTLPSWPELRTVRRRLGRSLWPDDFRYARLPEIAEQTRESLLPRA